MRKCLRKRSAEVFAEVVCGSVLGGVFVFFGGRVPRKGLRKCFAEALKYYRAPNGFCLTPQVRNLDKRP